MLKQQSMSSVSKSTVKGVERMVDYLQELGQGHLQLIFEYAGYVLKSDTEKGLSVSIRGISNYHQKVSKSSKYQLYETWRVGG